MTYYLARNTHNIIPNSSQVFSESSVFSTFACSRIIQSYSGYPAPDFTSNVARITVTSCNPTRYDQGIRYDGSIYTITRKNGFSFFVRRPPNVSTRTGVVMSIGFGATFVAAALISDLDNPVPQWFYVRNDYGPSEDLTIEAQQIQRGGSSWVRFGFTNGSISYGGVPIIWIYPTSAHTLNSVTSHASVGSGMSIDIWGPQLTSSPQDGLPPYSPLLDTTSRQAEFVRIRPSAVRFQDLETAEKQRASNGGLYKLLTGTRRAITFDVENMDETSRRYINDWWEDQEPLLFYDYTSTATSETFVTSCRIANDATPMAVLATPYSDQYNGTIELEVF